MRIWKSGWVLWKTKFLMIFEKFWRFIDVVHSLKSAISNVEKKEAAKGKHEENIFQEEMLRRRMQEELKIQEMKLQMKSKEWMKYLLFHNRNLQFALILSISMQKQFKDKVGNKCNSNSIVVVNWNINNKNNDDNTNKVIIVMKVVEQ